MGVTWQGSALRKRGDAKKETWLGSLEASSGWLEMQALRLQPGPPGFTTCHKDLRVIVGALRPKTDCRWTLSDLATTRMWAEWENKAIGNQEVDKIKHTSWGLLLKKWVKVICLINDNLLLDVDLELYLYRKTHGFSLSPLGWQLQRVCLDVFVHQGRFCLFITKAEVECLWLSYKSPEHGFPTASAESALTSAVQMAPQ